MTTIREPNQISELFERLKLALQKLETARRVYGEARANDARSDRLQTLSLAVSDTQLEVQELTVECRRVEEIEIPLRAPRL